MYSLAIYLYIFCVNVAAIFNRKARLLMQGHRHTFRILRENIKEGEDYVWFHVSSLGEFEQGRLLMERIRGQFPEYRILLTFFSPSGYEVQKHYKGADIICYLPFDTSLNAHRFIRLARPKFAFFIKYEFWQNYLSVLHKEGIPAYSVSSIFRPKQIFFRSWAKPYAHVLKCFSHFFVQNDLSRTLLATKGLSNVTVVGDTRFDRVIEISRQAADLPLVEAFREGGRGDLVMVCGSTWPADEAFLLDYFNRHKDLRLVLAPHVVSPEHLEDIERRLQRPAVRYSQANVEAARAADCLIIDGYGLLSSIYRYGKLAYVGGGFGQGLHNVPEAAVYGIPVIIGPNNANFREAQDLKALQGCFEVTSPQAFEEVMTRLAANRSLLEEAGQRAGQYIHKNAGAVDKIFNFVSPLLAQKS